MVARRGASTLGCVLPLLILAAAAFIGWKFAPAYMHYYQYRDAMQQEARFGQSRTDDQVISHLRAFADSLELPRSAGVIRITRGSQGLTIWSDYDETIELPFNKEKTIHFHPTTETGR